MTLTYILIGLNIIISMYAWQHQSFMESWVFHPYTVKRHNQWYRFITSGFLHADWGHLFFNMFSLYFFGSYVEQLFKVYFGTGLGAFWFIALFLIGVILSDVQTFIKHQDDRGYYSLGASGGVSTIIFASILYDPMNEICLYGIICLPGIILGILYLVYSYYEANKSRDNVNHSAHFYGALVGIVLGYILVPEAGANFLAEILQALHF